MGAGVVGVAVAAEAVGAGAVSVAAAAELPLNRPEESYASIVA